MVVWMSEQPMELGRAYLIKHCSVQTSAVPTELRYRMNINTLHREDGTGLQLNEIGRVRVECSRPLACDAYARLLLVTSIKSRYSCSFFSRPRV